MRKLCHYEFETRVLLALAGITARDIRAEAGTRNQRKRAKNAWRYKRAA